MADNTLLKLGIFGAAGYLAYKQGWLSFLGIGGGSTPIPTGGSGTPAPNSNVAATPQTPATTPAASAPSLAAVYSALVDAVGKAQQNAPANPDGTLQSVRNPDNYNAFLLQIYPGAGPLPDPNSLFANTGWSRPQDMPIAAYWAATSDWLSKNKGMSGAGFAGLGAIAMKQGWGWR